MRSFHRFLLVLSLSLCTAAALPEWSAAAAGGGTSGVGADSGISARVARLSADTVTLTRQYETGRRDAARQEAIAWRDQRLLAGEHRLTAVLHMDLGTILRAEDQRGGAAPDVLRALHPDDKQELTRDHAPLAQGDLALGDATMRSRLVEAGIAEEGARASARWRELRKRTTRLATTRRTLLARLEAARWTLQRQADASAAAGKCRGAVRLGLPGRRAARPWVTPVDDYRLTAGFGNGGEHWAHRHTGQDFAVPIGTPVRAAGAGSVVRVTCGGAFGIEIVIKHAAGCYTQYAHLAAVTIDPGDRVRTGQWIGQSGTTGNSTGPHVHFEVRITPQFGSGVDPLPWLKAHGVKV
ncbi:M23 family metallopeptidase [Streptomyces sp. NPDC048664]|uniref:M23 family metallopeptidase n=1 Tax=Streptomyces sp. NPDC048664 TaxID=3154505 RepID=UPI0034153D3C